MANNFIDKILKVSKSKYANLIEDSIVCENENEKDFFKTEIPMLNTALSGKINGGYSSGILQIAGKSKRFKTLFGLRLMKSFQDTFENGVCIFYDTEIGVNSEYLKRFDLDKKRIVHIPINCVEELKHELSLQLELLKDKENKNQKVFVLIDSIGNLASRKEIEDAIEGNEKVDMTRAKQLKSLFRIITVDVKLLKIPLVAINHTYDTQAFISREVASGGCLKKGTKIRINDNQYKNIEDIELGDKVDTLYGLKEVDFKWCPKDLGNRKCVKIEFEDGYEVICTEEHKFLVKNEDDGFIWKKAKMLNENDEIVSK